MASAAAARSTSARTSTVEVSSAFLEVCFADREMEFRYTEGCPQFSKALKIVVESFSILFQKIGMKRDSWAASFPSFGKVKAVAFTSHRNPKTLQPPLSTPQAANFPSPFLKS